MKDLTKQALLLAGAIKGMRDRGVAVDEGTMATVEYVSSVAYGEEPQEAVEREPAPGPEIVSRFMMGALKLEEWLRAYGAAGLDTVALARWMSEELDDTPPLPPCTLQGHNYQVIWNSDGSSVPIQHCTKCGDARVLDLLV